MKKLLLLLTLLLPTCAFCQSAMIEKAQKLVMADINKSNPVVKEYKFGNLDSLFSDYKTDSIYLAYELKLKWLSSAKALPIKIAENKYLDRYKGKFIGWKIRCSFSNGYQAFSDVYKFDKEVTEIIGYNDQKLNQ